mmetsp:Transcript_21822/g.40654  ORF Transcript_21822/g.40654 Transcript_21822/m.40654 type:complete len:795 (+) Transcript_21822:35-2419(+)
MPEPCQPVSAMAEQAPPASSGKASASDESSAAGRIVQLEETVINRIAAGEVVVRPANALKELMENSLDAGSKNIVVAAKGGGLKMLRIEDDGHGIRLDDLPILCERFTTSKLRKYEDLNSIATFGFRGEALASISHVAHVTVTTMTKENSHAYVAQYSDGKLRQPARPCAGTRGTTLVIEDMFYNNSTRRGALGKDSIEHSKLLDVVQKYAVHYPKVSFACRKAGSAVAELHTQGGDSTSLDVISAIYGPALAKELFAFEASSEEGRFSCQGYASGPQHSSRNSALTLFINHRLVECSALRRAMEAVYAAVLPRHQHPWIYLDLSLDPATVDVNVHPTKMEVQFLHEQQIAERIQEVLNVRLRERGGSRTFDTQPLMGGSSSGFGAPMKRAASSLTEAASGAPGTAARVGQASSGTAEEPLVLGASASASAGKEARAKPEAKAKPVPNPTRVRIDHRQQSLQSLWRHSQSSQSLVLAEADEAEAMEVDNGLAEARRAAFEEAQELTSLCELKEEASRFSDGKLSASLNQSVYVGPVSRELALLQCGKALCLVNLARVARECAYQRLLRSFGDVASISLAEKLPLGELLQLGVSDPGSGYDPVAHANVDTTALVSRLAGLLEEKAEMLNEYLGLDISGGVLCSLPNALGVTSDAGLSFDGLPLFLLRLCAETNWSEEKACFQSLCRVTADFCVELLLPSEEDATRVDASEAEGTRVGALNAAVEAGEFEDVAAAAAAATRKRARTMGPNALEELRWIHEAVRRDGACRWPAEFMRDGTVLELVSLDQLYRIFERC